MNRSRYGRRLVYVAATYLVLWLLTATVGLRSVDRAFDREFARGSTGAFQSARPAEVRRLPFQRFPLFSDSQSAVPPEHPFRMRTKGYAIAPFLVVDEVSCQTHAFSGWGGHRLVFWLFGLSTWVPLKEYWV